MDFQRDSAISRLVSGDETFDVVIIGGGATGLGTAVDAASRGHRVALIEQYDFAKGTSSRSTKLVHGGVRYLRQGNVSLVMEALKERGLLLKNAPHLCHNLAFIIPNYQWWEKSYYGFGMQVYDRMAGKLGLGRSHILNKEKTVNLIPTINQEHLRGGVMYYDGQFDDTRLALNLAQTAARSGAVIANYVKAVGLIKENGVVAGVEIEDCESEQQFTIRAKCVVNATGVFSDNIRQQDDENINPMVAASQGIHLVLPRKFLPSDTALMIPKTSDGRVLFAVPWHNHVIVGTTDTPMEQASFEPKSLEEEREFIMTHIRHYLTEKPSPADVGSVFAGLRPLVRHGDSSNTAALSRDHTIVISESKLLTIVGGKWTTYRKMAQDTVDRAENIAGLKSVPCNTQHERIHGWMSEFIADEHWRVYGADLPKVLKTIGDDKELSQPLHPEFPYQKGEIIWQVRHEMARTVEDVLARRTRMLFLNTKAAMDSAPTVAALIAGELGRNADWQRRQVEKFNAVAQNYTFAN